MHDIPPACMALGVAHVEGTGHLASDKKLSGACNDRDRSPLHPFSPQHSVICAPELSLTQSLRLIC